MRTILLPPILVAVALLAACDVSSTPTEARIEVRSASIDDDGSMRLQASIDDQDREVHIADVEGTRVVAVVAPTIEGPLVTLVSEAYPECLTDDAVACELTDAAFDGVLDDLAARAGDDPAFRLRPEPCHLDPGEAVDYCYVCMATGSLWCVGL